jgi:hypothetical protein
MELILMTAGYIALILFFVSIFVVCIFKMHNLMRGGKSDFESLAERYKENIEK